MQQSIVVCYVKNLTSSFLIEKLLDKKNDFPSDEFCNFYDGAGSVLDSQHYIHPWSFMIHVASTLKTLCFKKKTASFSKD